MTNDQQMSCTKAVLLDIPEAVLVPSVINIRRMLIRSSGMSTIREEEAKVASKIKLLCETKCQELLKPLSKGLSTTNESIPEQEIQSLGGGALFDLTSWLVEQFKPSSDLNQTLDHLEVGHVVRRAVFVINTLEQLADYATMLEYCQQLIGTSTLR